MKIEELQNNDYRKNEYWYKYLLRNLKELDKDLTCYLVPDFYHYEETQEKDILTNIQYINDITDFILQKVKNEKLDNEEEYDNYFIGNTEKTYDSRVDQYRAWSKLLEITERLQEQNDRNKIFIKFNKGYDFGFGICNFCTINVQYLKTKNHCTYSRQIIGISTTTGKRIELYKTNDYYEILFPNSDEVQRSNMKIKEKQEFDNVNDVIDETQNIINNFLDNLESKGE